MVSLGLALLMPVCNLIMINDASPSPYALGAINGERSLDHTDPRYLSIRRLRRAHLWTRRCDCPLCTVYRQAYPRWILDLAGDGSTGSLYSHIRHHHTEIIDAMHVIQIL